MTDYSKLADDLNERVCKGQHVLSSDEIKIVTTALRLAAARPQEPVAWTTQRDLKALEGRTLAIMHPCKEKTRSGDVADVPLYAHPHPVQVGRRIDGHEIARALCLVDGHDPDDEAPLTEMCTEDNQPVPWFMVYEEYADAILSLLNRPAT